MDNAQRPKQLVPIVNFRIAHTISWVASWWLLQDFNSVLSMYEKNAEVSTANIEIIRKLKTTGLKIRWQSRNYEYFLQIHFVLLAPVRFAVENEDDEEKRKRIDRNGQISIECAAKKELKRYFPLDQMWRMDFDGFAVPFGDGVSACPNLDKTEFADFAFSFFFLFIISTNVAHILAQISIPCAALCGVWLRWRARTHTSVHS